MEGNLKHFDLIGVLTTLAKAGRRGCIRISYPEGEGEIYFNGEWITKVALNPNPTPFGNRLMRKRLITREQLDDLLDEKSINQLPEPLGVLMVEKGWVKKEEIREYLKEHVKECFFVLFKKKEGEFALLEKVAEPEEKLIEIEELAKAMQERDSQLSKIKERIPSLQIRARRNSPVMEGALSEEEKLFLSLLDEERALEDIQRQGGFTEYETYLLAHNLLGEGLIEVSRD